MQFAQAFVSVARAADDPAGVEFFEKKIRPVLVEHCYSCHSKDGEKIKGGLLLDTKDSLLKGGDTGPAIVPGDAEKSLLIKAVRYKDENLQMPPKNKKLSEAQIADLETWVKMGAPDPRTGNAATTKSKSTDKQHWAFQPVKPPAIPMAKNKRRVQSPIDAFVLVRLEAKGLSLSPPADRRTLIRRVVFDLTGLPPTPEEVVAFINDKSSEAYANLVDRLLASPRYGERWARHWLDVARYADTKGYLAGDEQRRYPYSYTYRDYVIRAFNDDLPYDRFLIEQIAADHLPLGENKSALAAMGFLTLGRRFLNNQSDIIDDRIDVITRGTMGLTVACARCHDHKFDPILAKDYYALYGVFASSTEPAEKPLLGVIPDVKAHEAYLAERQKREAELKKFHDNELAKALTEVRRRSGDYLLAAHDTQHLPKDVTADRLLQERKLDAGVVRRWQTSLESWSKAPHPVFGPWIAFAALAENDFAAQAKELTAKFAANRDAAKPLNPLVAKMFAGEPPVSLKQVAERYGKLFTETDKQWQEKTAALTALPDANQEVLRQVLYGANAPAELPEGEGERLLRGVSPQLRQMRAKVEEVDATHPGAPPRAMSMQDSPNPHNVHVFIRGNPGNPGPEAPRQFIQILAAEKARPFQKGSGRLELAQAIASKDNPLTARVFVNRVWAEHFGSALVRTPSDFGTRSEPPTHPELLDFLAGQFMEQNWSVKKLHRLILLSSVYQQASDDNPRAAQIDPNNQLLWKMNRRRLDFEAMRDTLLRVAGKLDLTPGGLPVELTKEPFVLRRTVYGFIDRQNLPGLFRTFDFASPDTTSSQRFNTTVPQQALFLMNSPFVVQQATNLLDRADIKSLTQPEQRVQRLYELAFQRPPGKDETKLALRFLAAQPPVKISPPAWQFGFGEYDEASSRVKKFEALPHFTDSMWRGGAQLPDEKLGWALLNAGGGHAGSDAQHAVIRRWVAPREGGIRIAALFGHEAKEGDGVRGRIISSRQGVLGEWTVFNQKTETKLDKVEVREGEIIDFVTDCRTNNNSDSFSWSPQIKYVIAGAAVADGALHWNAQTDFGKLAPPKPLDGWEKFAQVLLLSNELVFVD